MLNLEELFKANESTLESLAVLGTPDFASQLNRQSSLQVRNSATGMMLTLSVGPVDVPSKLVKDAALKWGITSDSLNTMYVQVIPHMATSMNYSDFVKENSSANTFDQSISEIVLSTGPSHSNV